MFKALAEGVGSLNLDLPPSVLKRQLELLEELLRWNRQINLTSIVQPQRALSLHLLDSLALLKYLPSAGSLLDMGSGAGFPGLPLAIANPGLRIVSVDSVGKKILFQKHIKRHFSLENFLPIHCRLEE